MPRLDAIAPAVTSTQTSLRQRLPRPAATAPGRPTSRAQGAVDLSQAARTLDGQRKLLRGLLAEFESAVPAGAELFEQAGRSAYLDEVASSTDRSAEGTADRILGGITGYIFGAFRLSRAGDLDEKDLESFAAQAREGLERGLRQAGDLLSVLGRLGAPQTDDDGSDTAQTPGVTSDDIETIRSQVLERLDQFISDERARIGAA